MAEQKNTPTAAELAAMIDHTFLKPDGCADALERLCAEAVEYGFRCAMVNPCNVKEIANKLRGTAVRVGTVIGFPLGQSTLRAMRFEARDALDNGAQELDFVVNVRRIKAKYAEASSGGMEIKNAAALLAEEYAAMLEDAAVRNDITTKLIIETCYLADEEKVFACEMAKAAGFDFVKTSTGFGSGGATVEDVRLMRKTVGTAMGVKASGGIRDLATALAMVQAGANRLGCSAGVTIMKALCR